MRRVLPIALLATAVVNAINLVLFVVVRLASGSSLDPVWIAVSGLSAYGCWVAGRFLLQEQARAGEVASTRG